ncbi:uncharacterized protein PV07_06441 [Cladophialophora immunda]|uniref:Enoyl reductase (ER) domain-containing protein n=1 Tax=Cladophialophora immunda TaxID=569365 RepID=A0A0D2ANE5_9EURO|nr:uncharacterized protein PV07_06441 [Cladophialophora immunda]KIW26622.1 hypothetical protein PV07_06441 [Cladophialophora immunda]
MGIDFKVFKGSQSGEIVEAKGHREVGPTQALVALSHCGVCGTDSHYRHADQGLGHEGVGVIKEVGSLVEKLSDLRVGDRVGMGWLQRTCGYCKFCLTGRQFKCQNSEQFGTANLDQGCFGTGVAWDVSALFKIPDEIASESAGPLMCGGATVWGPLYEHGFKAGDRIGIIGIGGLGHLAIQFASKMGMEAVVFSGTESKKEEAFRFGAREFYATKGVTKFEGIEPVDCLLITTSVLPDLSLYLPVLAPFAKIFPLTISMDNIPVPVLPFIIYGYSIIGSGGAHPQSVQAMLRFAAEHSVKPVIEKFPMTQKGVTDAMTKLDEGSVRYRGVLEVIHHAMIAPKPWLEELTLNKLHRLATALGTPCSGTKLARIEAIRHATSNTVRDGDSRRRVPNLSLLSIDMGIRNLAFAHLTAPIEEATRPLKHIQYSMPTLQAWRRIAVAESLDTTSGRPCSALEKSTTTAVNPAEASKESFEPIDYARHAYHLVKYMLEAYQPNHVLIERQRFRSGGQSAVQEWTLRVGVFEGMLYSVLRTLVEEHKLQLSIEPMQPPRVNRYWLEVSQGLLGSKENKLVGRQIKKAKIDLVGHLLRDGSLDVCVGKGVQKTASDYVSRVNKASQRGRADATKMSKQDDLADSLLQGLAWIHWQNNRRRIQVLGRDAVDMASGALL